MEEMVDYLCRIHPLSPECLAYLRKVIGFRKLAKNELLLQIGDVDRHLYFMKSGALHCYYFKEGKAMPDWYFSDKESVVPLASFYDQEPCEDCLVAQEDCELYYITMGDYDYMMNTFNEFNYVTRRLAHYCGKALRQRVRFIRDHFDL
jgi:hypothetical protein